MGNKIVQYGNGNPPITEDTRVKYRDVSMMSSLKAMPSALDANGHSKLLPKADALINVEAVKNSLRQIFTWIPGERIINPEFGSNLRRLLYEGLTDYNKELIMAEIKHSVSVWEPRVEIESVVNAGNVDYDENNTVYLEIVHTIPSLTDEQFKYRYEYQLDN